MKKNEWISIMILAGAMGACTQTASDDNPVQTLAVDHRHVATAPYFTHDTNGIPVLCWTESDHIDSAYHLAFATYDPASGGFGATTVVTGSEGLGTSPESMGKVAFKDDGTIIAMFAKPFLHEKNRFAGAIYYTTSTDNGASWSPPQFLHSDTARHYGRNFFDMARLGNGEIGAVWLDGRDTSVTGSTLYFAATAPGQGFGNETVLHRGTCECCRTDLHIDHAGTVHVAYRSLMYPPALFGQQVRDMAYVRSTDHGASFSAQATISEDHWAIQACPHTGPTLAAHHDRLHAVWFTGGEPAGLYYAHSSAGHTTFGQRMLLSATGSHPQAMAIGSDTVLVVYGNHGPSSAGGHGAHSHDHGSSGHHHGSTHGNMGIVLHPIVGGHPMKPTPIASDRATNHHPVITQSGRHLLIAWVGEAPGKPPAIRVSRLNTDALTMVDSKTVPAP
ncbi:hypothetical protein ACFOET_16710 [Parapedobacter deserti]|uniref:Exo-alpha-sialidase n=1 Tax=Parapedobacter deserti TaxID=1912957 RepID=A0ABV7JT30_9SPHI